MICWNVYYDGKFIGQVQGRDGSEARLAAYSLYEPLDDNGHGLWETDKLSVSPDIAFI